MPSAVSRRGRPAALWGVVGVALLFADAIFQLGRRGIGVLRADLSAAQWVILALLVAAFVYGEGVRALQRRWVPHVMQRVAALPAERPVRQLLAPLYALALIGAPGRTLAWAWAGIAAIVLAVLIVRALPDPWRGMIDLAVALALTWGLGAILWQARAVLRAGREVDAQQE